MEKNKKQKMTKKSAEGSGSLYHKEHASHLPDYGGNTVDPNARGMETKE